MSGVLKRNRKETKMQFQVNAEELQIELTKFVMREKAFPKKWRFAIGHKIIDKIDELVDNIELANEFYPTDEQSLKTRIHYQHLAICSCKQLHTQLVRAIECVESVKVEQLGEIVKRLTHEKELLISWQKSSKIMPKQ